MDGCHCLERMIAATLRLFTTVLVVSTSWDYSNVGGGPIGYFNWDMIFQAVSQGIESAALFGGAYLALEFAFSKGWISKFES